MPLNRLTMSPCRRQAVSLIEHARPRPLRSLREFAESEVWIQHGASVSPYRCATQPVSGLFFDLLDTGQYNEVYGTGPSQSAKTTTLYLIPALHTACERRENAVHGVPLDEMVDDKFNDLYGMMRRSPNLRGLLPRTHREGRGGKIKDKQTLENGIELKPMTRAAGDVAKAGYPARWVFVTEAADWSHAQSSSPEADPLRQLKARQKSFPRVDRRLIVEGTVTIPEELPWRAQGPEDAPLTTGTQLLCPCPHGPHWISPEREHLVGWKEAANEEEAAERTRYVCPVCGKEIDDHQRRESVRQVRAVHRGQTVNEHGEVVGEPPRTRTLWYRWTAWHNLLLPQGDIGAAEYKAAQLDDGTLDKENAERELCQFDHAVPFKSTLAENDPLNSRKLRKRLGVWPRNVVPPDTTKLTLAVDVGDYTCWWLLLASRACNVRHVVGHGAFAVKHNKKDDANARLKAALNQFDEEYVQPGFVVEGADKRRVLDGFWVDGQYRTEIVAGFMRGNEGHKKDSPYRLTHGAGASSRKGFRAARQYTHPRRRTRTMLDYGEQWYEEINYARKIRETTFNADHWKLRAHDMLRRPIGSPGSIVFYQAADPKELIQLTNHLANEQLVAKFEEGKGKVDKWNRTGDQHLLDALAMALAAADWCGYEPDEEAVSALAEAYAEAKGSDGEQLAVTAPTEPAPALDWSVL